MKNFFLFSLIFFSSLGIAQKNNLVVFTQEPEPFYLILNGIRQNDNPETNVRVTDLQGDFHRLRVVFKSENLKPIDQSVSYLNSGSEIKMEVRQKKGKYRIRYAGEFKLDDTVREEDGQVNIRYLTSEQEATSLTQVETKQEELEQQGKTEISISGTSSNDSRTQERKKESKNKEEKIGVEALEDKQTEFDNLIFMANGSMCASPNVTQNDYMNFRHAIEETNMFQREAFILDYIKDHCMTAAQVAGILKLDYSTVKNYEIAKNAYRYTWDTENYGVVIEELKTQSDQEKLINFLDIGLSASDAPASPTQSSTQEIIKQPLLENYSGFVGCNSAALLSDINDLKSTLEGENSPVNQMNIIRQAASDKCFTVSQVETLSSVFSHESDRLDFIQWAFNYTYDIDNYYTLFPVFIHSANKEKLGNYIKDQPMRERSIVYGKTTATLPIGYSGRVGSYEPLVDEKLLKEILSEQVFTKDKILVLEHALRSRAITVDQFIYVADEFSSDKDVLSFAKLAYPKTYDLDNFYKVNEILTFDSSKKELNQLIE